MVVDLRIAALSILALVCAQDSPPFYTDKSKLLVIIDSGKEQPVATGAEWSKRRAHILANLQLVMGPMPDESRKVPLEVKILEEAKLEKYTRKSISFAVEKGDRVPAQLLVPRGISGRGPAALCLHPTSPLGKEEITGKGKPNRQYAAELAERGFVVLAPDYPSYGDYKIDVYAMGYASATMKGIWNHMRAVDLLQSLPEVDPDRIGVIGHSLGGHNSMFVAVFDPRIKVIVSSGGFNSFAKYMGGNLAGWSHKGYMPRIAEVYGKDPKKMPFDFTEIVGALAPRPFFINAPLHDAYMEVTGVRDCVEAALPVYALLGAKDALRAVYPDADHDFPPGERKAAYEFIEQALRK